MPEKVSKASVNYRLGGAHCHACVHFIESTENEKTETADCEVVQGRVKAHDVCDLFKRERGTREIKANHLRRIIGTL